MIKTEFPHQSLMYIYYSKKLKNKSQLYKALMKMYNLCLLKIGDINITVSSLHPLRSIQQDLTQDVKQPDAIKYIHEVSNKIFFYMTRRISSDRNYFFDSPMIRDLPPNSQRTTTPVKMIFQLTDFILPSKSLLENSSQINTVLAFLKS